MIRKEERVMYLELIGVKFSEGFWYYVWVPLMCVVWRDVGTVLALCCGFPNHFHFLFVMQRVVLLPLSRAG